MATIPVEGQAQNETTGWSFPFLGVGKGTWDTSVGLFLWKDTFHTRNLQWRSDIDLAPGVRWHTIVRSNGESDTLSGFNPHFDENYIEGYGFYHSQNAIFSTSLRVGTTRYLHFPYPDAIAVFDQVPGITDLIGGEKTGYSGELLTMDYADNSGLGLHASGINWGFGPKRGTNLMENYLFYRHNFGQVHFETHAGEMAVRPEPLGRRAAGYNFYLGTTASKYSVGLLYEKLNHQPVYTGIIITFPMDKVTKAMGKVAFDYDRSPQGLAMQVPLFAGVFNGIQKKAPANGVLVGEIVAERLRTYWQNGQARNYYEHRLSSWGETGRRDLIVVMKEEPWYLQAEALVSPHTLGTSFKTWEHDRQGPAQLSQKVTYQFYKVNRR